MSLIKIVAHRRLLRPLVAVRHLRVEIGLIAAVAVPVDPSDPLKLAAQQVNLLEIAAGFHLLGDQLAQPRLQREIDAVNRFDVIPAVALLPCRNCPLRRLQQFCNGAKRVALKEQVHGLPSGFDMGEK